MITDNGLRNVKYRYDTYIYYHFLIANIAVVTAIITAPNIFNPSGRSSKINIPLIKESTRPFMLIIAAEPAGVI